MIASFAQLKLCIIHNVIFTLLNDICCRKLWFFHSTCIIWSCIFVNGNSFNINRECLKKIRPRQYCPSGYFKNLLPTLLNYNLYGDRLYYWLFLLSSSNHNLLFNLTAGIMVRFKMSVQVNTSAISPILLFNSLTSFDFTSPPNSLM